MEPIKFATPISIGRPNAAPIKGHLWGFFDGELGDPALAPWLSKQITLRVPDALAALGPERALADKDALGRQLDALLVDAYQTCAATGRVVVESVPGQPAAAAPPPAAPGAGAFVPPRLPPIPPTRPKVVLDVDPLNVTADGMISPFAGEALPFVKSAPVKPPKSALSETLGAAPGRTSAMPALRIDDDGLPFDDDDDDDHPELTVEQYASLCVERALAPQKEMEAAQRYKILTEHALRALDQTWRKRLDAEGGLYQRWQEAYAQYEAWVRAHKSPSK